MHVVAYSSSQWAHIIHCKKSWKSVFAAAQYSETKSCQDTHVGLL